MNVGKALLLVLSRWNITRYRLAQLSGVSKSAIGKVINGNQPSLLWDDVEKIARGLAKADPLAASAFYDVLRQSDDFFYMAGIRQPEILEREKPENIQATLDTLLKLGIVTPEVLEQASQNIPKHRHGSPAMSLLEWISVNMQWQRLGQDEEQDNDQEN